MECILYVHICACCVCGVMFTSGICNAKANGRARLTRKQPTQGSMECGGCWGGDDVSRCFCILLQIRAMIGSERWCVCVCVWICHILLFSVVWAACMFLYWLVLFGSIRVSLDEWKVAVRFWLMILTSRPLAENSYTEQGDWLKCILWLIIYTYIYIFVFRIWINLNTRVKQQ